MEKLVERVKGLFEKGKDSKTALTDTAALTGVGFIMLWLVCDWYARIGPLLNNRFQFYFPRTFLTWVAICIAIAIYTSRKTTKGDKD